jgi:hypothetical protein
LEAAVSSTGLLGVNTTYSIVIMCVTRAVVWLLMLTLCARCSVFLVVILVALVGVGICTYVRIHRLHTHILQEGAAQDTEMRASLVCCVFMCRVHA